jgi:hypothetical protein
MLVRTICEQVAHRVADAHEQLLQQLTGHFAHLEQPPPPPIDPSPEREFTLTNNRRAQGSGFRPHPDQDQYQLSRADCPSFHGDNIIEWLRRCTSFFVMH